MNARLVSLLLCLLLVLTFGCSSEASPAPTPPATTSPAEPIFSPVPVSPTPIPAVSEFRPSENSHPIGTRTGSPKVDAVISAAESRDATALLALVDYYPMPCTEPAGVGVIPCPAGAPAGTPVEVFGWGLCEGTWVKPGDPAIREALASFVRPNPDSPLSFDPRVYAIVAGRTFLQEQVPGQTLIVFASGLVMSIDHAGLTYVSQTCVGNGEDWVKTYRQHRGEPDFILAPLR